MATFGRTARQDVLWGEFNGIRDIVDKGLLGPEEGEYDGLDPEPADLIDEWNDLVEEYADIHADNETFG